MRVRTLPYTQRIAQAERTSSLSTGRLDILHIFLPQRQRPRAKETSPKPPWSTPHRHHSHGSHTRALQMVKLAPAHWARAGGRATQRSTRGPTPRATDRTVRRRHAQRTHARTSTTRAVTHPAEALARLPVSGDTPRRHRAPPPAVARAERAAESTAHTTATRARVRLRSGRRRRHQSHHGSTGTSQHPATRSGAAGR